MDKYRIINDEICIMHDGIGIGYSLYQDKRELCRLLNEKDARKNQKKIDKLVVTQIILPVLHREIRLDKTCKYGGSLCGHKTKEMETAIEIISNLPC